MALGFPYDYTVPEVHPEDFNKKNRKFRRKIKKLRQKFFKFEEAYKYGLICYVATPSEDDSTNLLNYFLAFSRAAFLAFWHMIKWMMRKSKVLGRALLQFLMSQKYFIVFTVFISLSLALTYLLVKRFGKDYSVLKWFLIVILSLITLILLKKAYVEGVFDWLLALIQMLLEALKIIRNKPKTRMASESLPPRDLSTTKPSGTEPATCIFYMILTAVTAKIIVDISKRMIVGEGPLTEPIIIILEKWERFDGWDWKKARKIFKS